MSHEWRAAAGQLAPWLAATSEFREKVTTSQRKLLSAEFSVTDFEAVQVYRALDFGDFDNPCAARLSALFCFFPFFFKFFLLLGETTNYRA